ncbi:MAG: hypothetical protein AABW63_03185 [Nanoarchaeota archaeon]
MANDRSEQYKMWEKEIPMLQGKLRKKDPKHSLLSLVTVDGDRISWTSEFGGLYNGMTTEEGMNTYIADLRKSLK